MMTASRGSDVPEPNPMRAPIIATFQMASDSGAILGPVMVGLVVDRFGYTPGFALSGALLLVAVVPWLFATEVRDHPSRATPGE